MKAKLHIFAASTILVIAAAPAASAANLLANGDFEAFTGSAPDSWTTTHVNTVTTQVTGLDGSGSAVQLGNSTSGNAGSGIAQTVSPISNSFTLQFDFQLLTTGEATNNGSRILNFTMRNSNGDPMINARTLFDGSANNGALQFFNGSSWQSITGQTELFNQSDVYRISIAADNLGTSGRIYDVSLFNITDNASAGGETGISDFHFATPGAISRFQFERGRSNLDYIVDNASLVPEPSSALLALLATPALLIRRRRKDSWTAAPPTGFPSIR